MDGGLRMSTLKFNKWQSIDGVTRNAVLQVVYQENFGYSNTFFTTTSATFADATNMSATITPTSATSKIMIESVGGGLMTGSASSAGFRLLANDVVVWTTDRWGYTNTGSWTPVNWGSKTIHSPATASPVTYKFQIMATAGTSPQARIGDTSSGASSELTYTAVILTEIAQ